MNGAWRVFRREYRGYLGTVWIYGVFAAFLLLTGVTFYITADGTREATLRFWFPNLTFVLLVTLPVISSRTLAEERRNRHLDVLLSHPVDTFGVIVGKWLAVSALFTTFLAGTLVYVGLIAAWGSPDWPPLIAAYVGAVLTVMFFSAVGTLASSLTPTAVAAGLAGFAALVVLQLADSVHAFTALSFEHHLDDFARGAPRLTDIVYFLSGTVVALLLAGYWQVARRTIVRLRKVAVPAVAAAGALATNWAVLPVNTTYDVTAHGRYTLSNASRDVLRNVKAPVTLTGFEHANSIRARDMRLLFDQYHRAQPKIHVRVRDFDRYQGEALELGVTNDDQSVVQVGDRREVVDPPTELYITSALQRLARHRPETLCALTGHGERDLNDASPSGYKTARVIIEANGVKTETVDLTNAGSIPPECTVLGLFGPKIGLRQPEVALLSDYLEHDGKMIVTREPDGPDLDGVTKAFGLRFLPGVVVDPDRGVAGDPRAILANNFPTEAPIVDDVPAAFLVTAGGITTSASVDQGLSVARVVTSSQKAWLELNPAEGKFEPEKGDRPGPVVLAAAADRSHVEQNGEQRVESSGPAIKRTRLLLFADTDWAATAFADELGNRQLLGNAVNWLTGEENLIAVRGQNSDLRRLQLTAHNRAVMGWLSMGGLPASAVALGIGTWLLRRRR
ncbi:MAG TPA: Gldg family protein [Acidimicrobiia bacterium]|nr:Gldg family protein [Acidimicrobiia bacterium]